MQKKVKYFYSSPRFKFKIFKFNLKIFLDIRILEMYPENYSKKTKKMLRIRRVSSIAR